VVVKECRLASRKPTVQDKTKQNKNFSCYDKLNTHCFCFFLKSATRKVMVIVLYARRNYFDGAPDSKQNKKKRKTQQHQQQNKKMCRPFTS
jgi:hypothetical protein